MNANTNDYCVIGSMHMYEYKMSIKGIWNHSRSIMWKNAFKHSYNSTLKCEIFNGS